VDPTPVGLVSIDDGRSARCWRATRTRSSAGPLIVLLRNRSAFGFMRWERIWERNAAQRPRWRGMRRDGLDGREVVTCRSETREATGDGDRLAHNPEVMGRAARWAGQGGAHCCWSRYICWASLALGPLAVVRVCFHQMWPWCWRIVVVVADDLAMACQAPTVGANVDPQRGTPPLALDPSQKLPFGSAKVFEKLSALEG
jgi:hypothetical protein